jgi:hypothetical protein
MMEEDFGSKLVDIALAEGGPPPYVRKELSS